MGLHTSAWGRPIQGISQQPPKVRIEGQATLQVNAISSAVNGLYTRPGTSFIAQLVESLPEGTKWYYYNRGTDEEYFVAISPNTNPRVWDVEGDELTVEVGASVGDYLLEPEPKTTFNLTTISDFTFIANNKVIPEESSSGTISLNPTAIVSVQFADYGRTYSILINGSSVASYTTPDGSDSAHINDVDTTHVAEQLEFTLSGYTITRDRNTLFISRDNGSSFNVKTRDGADGRDLVAVQNSVASVDQLPTIAPINYLVEVVGTGTGNNDPYWLRADSIQGGTVKWVEAAGPDQKSGLDADTMPHVLVRDRFESGKAVFTLDVAPWEDRNVGTDDTNPQPSFIQDGVPITSVGTFQNRLYVTAGESVVLTQSNFFFNFYRRTVRTSLDDEPIDVYADTNQVNVLENSAVLDGDVVLFSSNGQFLLPGNQPITKENATLRYASTFESTVNTKPVAAGDVVFFAFQYGQYAGVREFYTDSFTDTKRARPVTDHVDEYILGTVKQFAVSTNTNQLLVLADEPNIVYVYRWLWEAQERVQSSWSEWHFEGEVLFMTYDRETIYFLIDKNGYVTLEEVKTGDPDDIGLTFPSRVDGKFYATATKGILDWTIETPYESSVPFTFIRGAGCDDAGVTVRTEQTGPTTFITSETLSEEEDEVKLIGGIPIEFRYQPTMPFIRDRAGKVIDTDRLIINDVSINYDKTGQTRVIVTNNVGVEREYTFNGRRVGANNNNVGFAAIAPGNYTFPVRQDSDNVTFQLVSDSHIPFQLRDMEWRGRFRQRGRRV